MRILITLLLALSAGSALAQSSGFEVRPFRPFIGDEWIGNAISYGPFRDGQRPGGAMPSQKEIIEDLRIMAKHWKLLRIYGSEVAEPVLSAIRKTKLPFRVIVGAWIVDERKPGADGKLEVMEDKQRQNEAQTRGAIAMAKKYPELVAGLSIGNETQVFWSDHITDLDDLIKYIRMARAETTVPVTTADDFNCWNKPQNQRLGAECDFIIVHIHAHWAGCPIETAMQWTERIYRETVSHLPMRQIVIGEAGWATSKVSTGEEGRLVKGAANEKNQAIYYHALRAWAKQHKICVFNFEAFDENWKGGNDPKEIEKHWGVYNTDRSPKKAVKKK